MQARTRYSKPEVPLASKMYGSNSTKNILAENIEKKFNKQLEQLQEMYTLHCSGLTSEELVEKKICSEIQKEFKALQLRIYKTRDLFVDKILTSDEHEGEDANWLLESFLSQVSATISSSIRQVFVPGSPLYPTYYSEKIVYHFFIISNHNVHSPFPF